MAQTKPEPRRDIEKLLNELPAKHVRELIHSIATSCASFIAAIDSDSSAVAAYLEQRLQLLTSMALVDIRCRDALERIAADGRVLVTDAPSDSSVLEPYRAMWQRMLTDAPSKPEDPTASWPLCAECGKSPREGNHATDLGSGHDYVPSEPECTHKENEAIPTCKHGAPNCTAEHE